MILIKEDTKTIIFGYGDVITAGKVIDGKGFMYCYHTENRLAIGEVPDKNTDFGKPTVQIRFDNVESLDVLISQLKRTRKEMKKSNKPKIYTYKIDWSEGK